MACGSPEGRSSTAQSLLDGDLQHIDFTGLVGRHVTVYGQTEVTHDLMDARRASSLTTIYEAEDVALHDIARAAPHVTWRKDGVTHSLACDFIAGCDGSHGVSRASIPERALTLFDRHYPFGWLGIMVAAAGADELIYANQRRLRAELDALARRAALLVQAEDERSRKVRRRFWDDCGCGSAPRAGGFNRAVDRKSIAPLRSSSRAAALRIVFCRRRRPSCRDRAKGSTSQSVTCDAG